MGFLKKAAAIITAASAALSGCVIGGDAVAAGSAGIAIIHTNDVHCGINADDTTFGYADVAAYRQRLESEGYATILVDAGDYIQGGIMGTLSKGEYLVDIMNETGYDVATLGNHEFDFGTKRLKALADMADFDIVSANFVELSTGDSVFNSFVIKEVGGVKIGFVGVTAPGTITSADPSGFKDENGEYIYGFCGGGDGSLLYAAVQQAVDSANDAGAEYIVALTHLGEDPLDSVNAYTLIAATDGIDMVIDGDSHIKIEGEEVANKHGDTVLLSSTGTRIETIGTMFIDAGSISAALVTKDDYTPSSDENSAEHAAYAAADAYIKGIEAQYAELVNTVVATTDVALVGDNPLDSSDKVARYSETNLGDFCADAYRAVLGVDVGFVNGGGVRGYIPEGEITYGNIIAVHPFGNEMCVVLATGQEIIDALEVGARKLPEISGAFLQVSGVSFEIHSYIPSSVVLDENEQFVSVDGEYRVKNVTINGEPIDPEGVYTVASNAFIIKSGGSGLSMFTDNELLMDGGMTDNQVLIDYMTEYLGGNVGEEYANALGSGRITVLTESPEQPADPEIPEEPEQPEEPSEPEAPSEPEQPETPSKPEAPDNNPHTGVAAVAVVYVALPAAVILACRRWK